MVEVTIDDVVVKEANWLLLMFGINTSLLVTCHLVALMISTCILPNMEVVSSLNSAQSIEESPHDRMRYYIEIAWIFSTGFGILLFLSEIALLSWVKFYNKTDGNIVPIAATIIVLPAALFFIVFSLMYYKRLMEQKSDRSSEFLGRMMEDFQQTNYGQVQVA